MKLFLTIIIPVYNSNSRIQSCLESIINNKYKNLEIIIIDDGSTDGSREIFLKYSNRFSFINIIYNNNNMGPSHARNLGIDNAKGKYIMFVDSDDQICVGAINKMVSQFNKELIQLCVCDFTIGDRFIKKFIFERSKIIEKENIINHVKRYLNKSDGYNIFSYIWGKVYLKKIIQKNQIRFDENSRIYEDIKFNFNYLVHVNKIFYCRKKLYKKSGGESVMTAQAFASSVFSFLKIYENIFSYLITVKLEKNEIRMYLSNSYIYFCLKTISKICRSTNFTNLQKLNLIKILLNNKNTRSAVKYYALKRDIKFYLIMFKLDILLIIYYRLSEFNYEIK
jgi:glycosyltransferase involved in cell wall biosynthesis